MGRYTMIGYGITLATALALAGPAQADRGGFYGMGYGDAQDAQCEQDAHDLQTWLLAMADGDPAFLSDAPLDEQLLQPEISPLAARMASECPAVGWALMRAGSAAGPDKAAELAELIPEAIARCGCDLDLGALRALLWQVCASAERVAGAPLTMHEDADRTPRRRHDREDRTLDELREEDPQRKLAQHRGPGNPRAPRRTERDQAEPQQPRP